MEEQLIASIDVIADLTKDLTRLPWLTVTWVQTSIIQKDMGILANDKQIRK